MQKFKVTIKYDDNTSCHFVGRYKNAMEAVKTAVNRLKYIKKGVKYKKFCRLVHE